MLSGFPLHHQHPKTHAKGTQDGATSQKVHLAGTVCYRFPLRWTPIQKLEWRMNPADQDTPQKGRQTLSNAWKETSRMEGIEGDRTHPTQMGYQTAQTGTASRTQWKKRCTAHPIPHSYFQTSNTGHNSHDSRGGGGPEEKFEFPSRDHTPVAMEAPKTRERIPGCHCTAFRVGSFPPLWQHSTDLGLMQVVCVGEAMSRRAWEKHKRMHHPARAIHKVPRGERRSACHRTNQRFFRCWIPIQKLQQRRDTLPGKQSIHILGLEIRSLNCLTALRHLQDMYIVRQICNTHGTYKKKLGTETMVTT